MNDYLDRNTHRRWTGSMSDRAIQRERENLNELRRHGLSTRGDRDRMLDLDDERERRAMGQ